VSGLHGKPGEGLTAASLGHETIADYTRNEEERKIEGYWEGELLGKSLERNWDWTDFRWIVTSRGLIWKEWPLE